MLLIAVFGRVRTDLASWLVGNQSVAMDAEHPADHLTEVTAGEMTACHHCDTLYRLPALGEGEAAICQNCGAKLLVNTRNGLHRAAAFSISATVLLVISNLFPFMSITAAGSQNTVNLFDSVQALWEYRDPWLASALFAFIIGLPVLICLCQLYILLPMLWGKVLPGARTICRFCQHSVPWSMVEVFFLGVLVSLLKLVSLADVTFEVAFWTFGGLIFCLTASLVAIDRRELWENLNPDTHHEV